ncbi:hypothetical protein [Paraburkholderia susongensis]|uniref:hypothetical protein n=1 Tax=Paraburkholderia susongensis TaxID=1515439 RepID=UPI00118099E6|nr:hypothetical protein [Paraburkholderia susongensis]
MKRAILKPDDASGNDGVVTEGIDHSAAEGDPFANGACTVIFRIVADYRESFGDHFDSLPFLTSGGYFVEGASLRSAKSGCEIWSRLQWDICRCRHRRQDWCDEQFVLTGNDGRPMSGVHYRVRVGSNVVASGVTDSSGRTVRITTGESLRLRLEVA